MRVNERLRDAAVIGFAVSGGGSAWTLQLWLSWIIGEPLCYLGTGEGSQPVGDGRLLWLLVGLGCAGLALAALAVSFRLWARSGGRSLIAEQAHVDVRAFLAYVGLVLNLVFGLTIVLGLTAPLFLDDCR